MLQSSPVYHTMEISALVSSTSHNENLSTYFQRSVTVPIRARKKFWPVMLLYCYHYFLIGDARVRFLSCTVISSNCTICVEPAKVLVYLYSKIISLVCVRGEGGVIYNFGMTAANSACLFQFYITAGI